MAYYGKNRFSNASVSGAVDAPKKRGNPNWKGPYKKGPEIVRGSKYNPILNPSTEQVAIFEHMKNDRPLMVPSYAGTGKTSTIIEAFQYIKKLYPNKSILYLIFASKNAIEAKEKTSSDIEVSTVHSCGFSALKRAYGPKIDVDKYGEKDYNIATALLGPEDEKADLRYNFVRAINFAKGYLCETVDELLPILEKHEVEFCNMNETEFCQKVFNACEIGAQQYMRITFEEMLYIPIKKNLSFTQYDVVAGDEIQDNSPARNEVLLRSLKPGGKLITVGDRNQEIFQFASSCNAIDKIIDRVNPDILALKTTFRCPKSVVRMAQEYVSDYVADENNIEGEVKYCGMNEMLRDVRPGDAILSRVNAPLVSICLNLLKEGRKASILGKEMGKGLSYMLKRSEASDVNGFLDWLSTWESSEIERLVKKNKETGHISDKADVMRAFCEGTNDLSYVRKRIDEMFSDEDNHSARVVLSSIHRSKGAEWNNVFLLNDTCKPGKSVEEKNIFYVGITRSKRTLTLVSGKTVPRATETKEE